ncbi:hypothetical protein Ac42p047 [Acinetobacter phage Ac42]|nr:hypothetical protein Ac42p047 [Acinetobacter phage Ac42]ADI96285.1 hypothetical protein Ac42p047 [Acinetobacter phage Ac42]
MSKVKAQVEQPQTSKVGKLRDPKATMKLSLKLGFMRAARNAK